MTDLTEDEQTAIQLAEAQEADDFKGIMLTPGGRRFFWSLVGECRVFQPIWHEDHAVMCVREGKRQVGLMLLSKINIICPDLYEVMRKENTTYKPTEE